MSDKSLIEWTDATWNPLRGCSRVSPGCQHCYAEGVAARFSKPGQPYDGLAEFVVVKTAAAGKTTAARPAPEPRWTGKVVQAPRATLLQPLRWRKPRRIFVNSMSDLFHESVPDAWIDQVFAVMALCPQHTFQVLTKRPERMRAYLTRAAGGDKQDVRNHLAWVVIGEIMGDWSPNWVREGIDGPNRSRAIAACTEWPLPNVWLGVSAEDQQRADQRIPVLLDTPAAVRFVSLEPLLGSIDLRWAVSRSRLEIGAGFLERGHFAPGLERIRPLDWVIVGGESGTGARPMHPDWARWLRDQCAAAGVPFFFKQWGEWTPGENVERQRGRVPVATRFDGRWSMGTEDLGRADGHADDQPVLYRIGRAAAGRRLDGATLDGMPSS